MWGELAQIFHTLNEIEFSKGWDQMSIFKGLPIITSVYDPIIHGAYPKLL
jgi:hypothetical protein